MRDTIRGRAGTYTLNNGRWSFYLAGLAATDPRNPLANTTWELVNSVNNRAVAATNLVELDFFADGTGRASFTRRSGGGRDVDAITWSMGDGRLRLDVGFGMMLLWDYELSGSTLRVFYQNRTVNAYSVYTRIR